MSVQMFVSRTDLFMKIFLVCSDNLDEGTIRRQRMKQRNRERGGERGKGRKKDEKCKVLKYEKINSKKSSILAGSLHPQ